MALCTALFVGVLPRLFETGSPGPVWSPVLSNWELELNLGAWLVVFLFCPAPPLVSPVIAAVRCPSAVATTTSAASAAIVSSSATIAASAIGRWTVVSPASAIISLEASSSPALWISNHPRIFV